MPPLLLSMHSILPRDPTASRAYLYLSFFLGLSWLVWPHFFLRQLVARGGRRACCRYESSAARPLRGLPYVKTRRKMNPVKETSLSRVMKYRNAMGKMENRKEGRCRMGWTYVAFPADHLVAVVLASQSLEGGLDDTTTETEDKMKGRLLW